MNGVVIKACGREDTMLLHAGDALTVSLVHVVCGATLPALVMLLAGSIMDNVDVDLGLHHYAESASPLSTHWLPMPFNTIVNVGYVAVGIFWMLRVHSLLANSGISVDGAYLIYVFAWMVVLYGPVQLVRVITHWRVAGILDQWYTLPIFAWVAVSCREIGSTSDRLDFWSISLIITASLASYGLVVMHTRGFEVALGAHISGVVAQAWWVHRRLSAETELDRQRRWGAFVRAVVCCTGFVTLKLGDWHLARLLPVPFAVLTGHFWSKIADFMQVHYSCQFLEAALSTRLHTKAKSVSCHSC